MATSQIASKFRRCDVVKVRIGDLVTGSRVRSRVIVVQRKTGGPVQFEMLESTRASMFAWLECRGGALDDFVFPSRSDAAAHISTRQYAQLVDEWVVGIGLQPEEYGTDSLRRTRASIIYKQTGNLRAVRIRAVAKRDPGAPGRAISCDLRKQAREAFVDRRSALLPIASASLLSMAL